MPCIGRFTHRQVRIGWVVLPTPLELLAGRSPGWPALLRPEGDAAHQSVQHDARPGLRDQWMAAQVEQERFQMVGVVGLYQHDDVAVAGGRERDQHFEPFLDEPDDVLPLRVPGAEQFDQGMQLVGAGFVDECGVAPDDAVAFQAIDTSLDRRHRQRNRTCDVGQAGPRVPYEMVNDLTIDRIHRKKLSLCARSTAVLCELTPYSVFIFVQIWRPQ
jgi:hypothetical protein